MDGPSSPHLREAALEVFSKEWAAAIDQAEELARTLERLSTAMHRMADHGSHMQLVFEDRLTQTWWVAYREAKDGELMVLRDPAIAPEMQHEDLIVRKTITRGEVT